MTLGADVKGDAYEGVLEKSAADTKSGAGQYFTPRALISALVDVMRPSPDVTICDPACGTGGFFLAAYEYILNHHPHLDPDQKKHLGSGAFTGWEIVDNTARLCAMNMLLHGIEAPDSDSPVHVDDAPRADPGTRFDMVLANPPFGKKSSVTIVTPEGKAERQSMTVVRDDFWASTSNKQLNFVQHVKTLLKVGGSAAVVVPDNVLFEGGAGETVRRRLLHECDVHTLLRLPTGIFYAQGVKANVLFFERKPARTRRGRGSCGSTTSERTSTSRSRRTPSPALISTTSSTAIGSGHARSASSPSGSTGSPTTSSSSGTRRASTSSGSATTASRAPTTSRRPASSPPRSSRTSRLRSPSSASWPSRSRGSAWTRTIDGRHGAPRRRAL